MAPHTTRGLSRTICIDNMSFSGVYSSSADVVKYILRNVSADDLQERLYKALNAAPIPGLTPGQIDDLLGILKAVGLPAAAIAEQAVTAASQNARHCARCHQNYLERDNGQRECCIFHSDTLQAQPGPDADVPIVCVRACCPTVPSDKVLLYHFVGRHTTNAQNVAYNNVNVWACHAGCPSYAPAPPIDFVDTEMFSESSRATTRCSTPVGPTLSLEDEEYLSRPQRQSSISTDVSSSDISTAMSSNSLFTEMSSSDISAQMSSGDISAYMAEYMVSTQPVSDEESGMD